MLTVRSTFVLVQTVWPFLMTPARFTEVSAVPRVQLTIICRMRDSVTRINALVLMVAPFLTLCALAMEKNSVARVPQIITLLIKHAQKTSASATEEPQ